MHPVAEFREEVANLKTEIAKLKADLASLKPTAPEPPPRQFRDECGLLRYVASGTRVLPPDTKSDSERQREQAAAATAEVAREKEAMAAEAAALGHPPGSWKGWDGQWRSKDGRTLRVVEAAIADRARGEAALAWADGWTPTSRPD